jgi:hypothetical protein
VGAVTEMTPRLMVISLAVTDRAWKNVPRLCMTLPKTKTKLIALMKMKLTRCDEGQCV